MNEYKFNDNEKSISIKKTDLPSPWINYLSNGHMHAFVSQCGGGLLWLENSAKYRITRYRTYNLPIDSPGFYIYIREKDGNVWSPTFRPVETKLDSFEAKHYPGKTKFIAEKNGTEAVLTLFVMPDYDILAWHLDLKNKNNEAKELDVFAYVELSQMRYIDEVTNDYYWRHMLNTWFDKESQTMQYLYHFPKPEDIEKQPLVYFGCNRDIVSYSGDRDAFMGNYRFENNPVAVENAKCGNEEIQSGEPCAALHTHIKVAANSIENITFYLGAEEGALENIDEVEKKVKHNLEILRNQSNTDAQEKKLDEWWNKFLGKFDCKIPDEIAQRQINIWGPVDSVHTARYSRSINANAPGTRTLGFRDTCQDMLAITYRKPETAKARLKYLMSKQYKEGNAIHCEGFYNNDLPDYVTRCDDHLWLAFLVYSIIAETGDIGLLDEQIPYLANDHISEGESATIWKHLIAGVSFTESHLGEHGLPLTLRGDWNDIIGKFSREGKGESVFAAQQYVVVLNYMIEIAEFTKRDNDAEYLKDCRKRQIEGIEKYSWNGDWWYRCFNDEGKPLGSKTDDFGKIWINSQTWSVISGTGTKEQQRQAMDAVNKYLDTGVGLMKLTPGFETWPKVTDPFSGYNPGNGENGAVFCHAHTWAVIAEAKLGNAELAWKYYNDLVPHNIISRIGIDKYKSEPYAWCSNIIGYPNNKQGWGNISHISGTVAWMNIAATQYLLGVRPVLNGIVFEPCISSEWEEYEVKREYRGVKLNIHFNNPNHKSVGVTKIELNKEVIKGNFLPYDSIKNINEVCINITL